MRLIVSGHSSDPQRVYVRKSESEDRLIPWIGAQVMATQQGVVENQIGLREIKWEGGRIIIHPNNIEGGERLAHIIRAQMSSTNHPAGFECEWNENMPLCAELTIRCPQPSTSSSSTSNRPLTRQQSELTRGGSTNDWFQFKMLLPALQF